MHNSILSLIRSFFQVAGGIVWNSRDMPGFLTWVSCLAGTSWGSIPVDRRGRDE